MPHPPTTVLLLALLGSALTAAQAVLVAPVSPSAVPGSCAGPVLSNGGFELGTDAGLGRPAFWYVGFADEPLPDSAGNWTIDSSVAVGSGQSLRLEPREDMGVSQVLHLPTGRLAGRTISVEAWIRQEGVSEPPFVLAAALNPEILTPDPLLGPGVAGAAILMAGEEEGAWRRYSGSFTVTAPASLAFQRARYERPGLVRRGAGRGRRVVAGSGYGPESGRAAAVPPLL